MFDDVKHIHIATIKLKFKILLTLLNKPINISYTTRNKTILVRNTFTNNVTSKIGVLDYKYAAK